MAGNDETMSGVAGIDHAVMGPYDIPPHLTRALKLIARADLALRSNAPSKRLVLENLVMQLCEEPKVVTSEWQQEELVL